MTIQTLSLEMAETAPAYFKRLKGMNIKRLGVGGFSNVYEHPTYSNIVVKVIKLEDPSFLKYVKLCRKYTDNQWLPRFAGEPIRAKTTFSNSTGQDYVWVVFAERLKPLRPADMKRYSDYFASLGSPGLERSYQRYYGRAAMQKLAAQTQDKPLANAAKIILSIGGDLDIKSNNIMLRGDQLVFTDPVAN